MRAKSKAKHTVARMDHVPVQVRIVADDRENAGGVIAARLFKQAAALAQGRHRGLLILEGRAADQGDGGVSREALQGALVTVSVFYGLAVLRARDAAETARLLVY